MELNRKIRIITAFLVLVAFCSFVILSQFSAYEFVAPELALSLFLIAFLVNL